MRYDASVSQLNGWIEIKILIEEETLLNFNTSIRTLICKHLRTCILDFTDLALWFKWPYCEEEESQGFEEIDKLNASFLYFDGRVAAQRKKGAVVRKNKAKIRL